MPVRYDLTVKADMSSIPKIRDMLGQIMVSSRFSRREILEAQLALEEACTNIALYAYTSGEGMIHVSSEVNEDILTIDIEDCGVPFDITRHKAELLPGGAKDRPVGGVGIYLIKKLMNGISYNRKDGKNILHLTKIHSI